MVKQQTQLKTIGTSNMRRALRILAVAESAATQLVQSLSAEHSEVFSQPGSTLFPKNIFVLDEGSNPVPDGQSLAYFELVQTLWTEAFNREPKNLPTEFIAATAKMVHQAIIDAAVVERRLIERLEATG